MGEPPPQINFLFWPWSKVGATGPSGDMGRGLSLGRGSKQCWVILKHAYLWVGHVDVDACEVLQRLGAVAGFVEVSSDGLRAVELFHEAVDLEDVVVDGVALYAGRRPACHAVGDIVEHLVARRAAVTSLHLITVRAHRFTYLRQMSNFEISLIFFQISEPCFFSIFSEN